MKKFISALSALAVMCSYVPVMPENLLKTSAVSAMSADAISETETFFVVVGTYYGDVQLRYFDEDNIKKVVWKDAPEDLSYGDVLVADGEVSMTYKKSMPDNPVYAIASYYELNAGTELSEIGNCSELMEQKELTVTGKDYIGSGQWTVLLSDTDGVEYRYGLNVFGSSLGVNPTDTEVGDVCVYSFYDGNIIIPLEESETDNAFDAETFFVVVSPTGSDTVQLRYFSENSVDRVLWKYAPEGLSYGDVLVADGEVSMNRVQTYPDIPNLQMAYHYELDEDAVLTNSGNCSEIMELKELSITEQVYDGSGHWSIHLTDTDGQAYYYGLMNGTLGINLIDGKVGDAYIFSFCQGNIIIPVKELNSTDIMGDTNGDGIFSVADVILLQKWLLDASDVSLNDWKTADFHEDGVLDIFDLCLMKKALIEYNKS